MRDVAEKIKRPTSAGKLASSTQSAFRTAQSLARTTSAPAKTTQGPRITHGFGETTQSAASALRRTAAAFITTGVTEIRSIRPPASQSRAMVPVGKTPEARPVGQWLDDITLWICILGVIGTLACTAAALMGWI